MSRFVLVCAVLLLSTPLARADAPRLAVPALSLSVHNLPLPLAIDASLAADPRPSSGLGMLIPGWIATAGGLVALAIIPVCFADFYPSQGSSVCAIGQGVIGGVALTLGVTFLIIGSGQRSRYKAWKERHPVAYHLGNTQVAIQSDAALLTYATAF